ncbi:hypothetical protein CEP53_007247 [Fusarium sp. AF-6]|nr:hypothetical protein CEP53_007247 [Fusarium sp. AF-6]
MAKTKVVDETFSDDSSDCSDDSFLNNGINDEMLVGASLLQTRTTEQFLSHHDLDPAYNISIHVPDARPPEPYQYGGDITTDGSPGKIWELKQSQFGFGGGWPVVLHHICRVVHPSNSWQPTVRVEIEKMAIYEKGATYKSHTDIEKRQGVFGTVMISLPSKHEGGVMTFEYCGQKPRRYKSHLKTQSFATWYTGVSHKLAPITSSYRWVLVLKLIDNRNALNHVPTGLMFPDEIQTVKRALERWLELGRESRLKKCLHYLLEKDYLSAKGKYRLRGQDLGRVQLLRAAYSELPIEVFVGSLEGKAVPRGKDVYRIKTLVDLDDNMVAQDLPLDEKDILDRDEFREVKGKDAFVQFGEFEHFKVAAMHHQNTLPSSFFKWLRGWVVASPDKLLERFTNIQQGASLAISSCGYPSDQFKFITQLAPLPSGEFADEVETPKPMLDWAREMIRPCLDSIGSDNLDRAAGSRIVDLSPYFSDPIAFLKTTLPKFRGIPNPLPFHLRFLVPGKLIYYTIPLDRPCHQQLCSALVKSLLDNLVGPEPVDTESQTRGTVSCGCVYCTQLNEFLADSSQSIGTLPIARTEREHLKDQLKSTGIDCKCEAVPGDSPCTLMTKAPSQQHVENREAWVGRQKTALDLLRKMEKSHLEQLIGPDYSIFLKLERVVDPSSVPQPVARMKRKVSDTDIVDMGEGTKKNLKITSFFTKK